MAMEERIVRAAHFQKVMDAIRMAINSDFEPPEISDRELKQLVIEARAEAKSCCESGSDSSGPPISPRASLAQSGLTEIVGL